MKENRLSPARDSTEARWQTIWQHRADLLRLARSRVATESDAEDVVHEAMTLAAADPRVELDRAGAWLNRVVRNRCADIARERSYADKRVIYEYGRARVQPLTEDIVCDNAEAAFLTQMLETLPSRQHEALLHASEGLSNAQIATAMSTTVKAIESLLVKARRTLRMAAAAAVTGFACLVRRPIRSVPSAAGLVVLSVGLGVYAFHPPVASPSRAPLVQAQTNATVVTQFVKAHAATASAHDRLSSGAARRTLSTHIRKPVQIHRHHGGAEVKAGPTDTNVSTDQYGPIANPVPDAAACVRGGVIVSLEYVGCRNSRGR